MSGPDFGTVQAQHLQQHNVQHPQSTLTCRRLQPLIAHAAAIQLLQDVLLSAVCLAAIEASWRLFAWLVALGVGRRLIAGDALLHIGKVGDRASVHSQQQVPILQHLSSMRAGHAATHAQHLQGAQQPSGPVVAATGGDCACSVCCFSCDHAAPHVQHLQAPQQPLSVSLRVAQGAAGHMIACSSRGGCSSTWAALTNGTAAPRTSCCDCATASCWGYGHAGQGGACAQGSCLDLAHSQVQGQELLRAQMLWHGGPTRWDQPVNVLGC